MKIGQLRRYALPLALGLLSLLLVVRVLGVEAGILVPEDADVLFLLAGLAVVLIFAIHALVRLSLNYLRQLSVQRVRAETLAEHARFLRRLDHELKNPLMTLNAGLKTLNLTDLSQQQQRLTSAMDAEVRRMTRLVTALRNLADLEGQPLNLQPVALDPFVRHR
ncbi:MAG: histidine kinase dimerization/phospho-acceptor domain-containing protein [Caldilineaceae bacterium]